jgi:spermidine synthase
MNYSPRLVYILSFVLAFCSLTYELIFAQILSVCLGGTKNQYLLTISIFTFALGIGSIFFGLLKEKIKIQNLFIIVEIILTILGAMGPFVITWILRINDHSIYSHNISKFISYFLIFLVGFFSGFELPCLFSLSEKNQGKVLAYDYLGMLTGSLFFPLIGLPLLGTAGAALMVSNTNLLALYFLKPFQSRAANSIIIFLNIISLGMIFLFREEFNHLLTSIYLIGV